MTKFFSSFVPGYTAVSEFMGDPPLQHPPGAFGYSEVNGWRRAWGGHFRITPNFENWFHIAIPSPVYVDDKRAKLGKVMLQIKVDNGVLQRVLVFDGKNEILDRQGLDVSGDHSNGLTQHNTFDVNREIFWGVGLSLNVKASPGSAADIFIASAGGDFWF